MVYIRFSHLVLSFGSPLLLFCPMISGDYKVAQLIAVSWQDFEI